MSTAHFVASRQTKSASNSLRFFGTDAIPKPESPTNAFRKSITGRLAYADEHFASGIPGRKTDRGRIYIIWGRPDENGISSGWRHYDRPLEQGGGSSTRIHGNCGATVIWKGLEKTFKSNLWI